LDVVNDNEQHVLAQSPKVSRERIDPSCTLNTTHCWYIAQATLDIDEQDEDEGDEADGNSMRPSQATIALMASQLLDTGSIFTRQHSFARCDPQPSSLAPSQA
jgi:hypothetical protein